MGFKTQNLEKLVKQKINVHAFQELDNFDALKQYSQLNDKFSIRFDSIKELKGLPFYIYDERVQDKDIFFKEIIDQMQQLHCTLLCSNGHKDDDDLKFNFVVEIDDKYNFMMEICSSKTPLRLMYEHKTTVIKGNLLERQRTFTYYNINDNNYTKDDIEYLLTSFLHYKYKYIEGSLYTKKVGLLNDYFVIWEAK